MYQQQRQRTQSHTNKIKEHYIKMSFNDRKHTEITHTRLGGRRAGTGSLSHACLTCRRQHPRQLNLVDSTKRL